MNNEIRKALMEVIEAELDSYCPSPFNGAFAVSLTQIIDRLLAERHETTVPDAERVERAAKAIHRRGPASGQDFRYRPETEQEMYRDMARASLATAGPDAGRVERAADAIYDYLANSNDLDEMIGEVELLIAARESAKVALAAAGPDAEKTP